MISEVLPYISLESQLYPGLHSKQCVHEAEGENLAPPLCSHEIPPTTTSEFSSPEGAWVCWGKSSKMIKGMGHLSYEEKLGELELLSLKKIRLWGDVLWPSSTWGEPTRKMERNSLQEYVVTEQGERIQTDSKFTLDIRKILFTVRMVRNRHKLPRKVVAAPVWKCSRPGWMAFKAIWCNGRCPCLLLGFWN